MSSKLTEIKIRILEIRDSLSEPLKSFLNEKIKKTGAYFEENESVSEINILYFELCFEYAEKCKKIEKDFSCRRSNRLTADNKLFNTFIYKLLSFYALDKLSKNIGKIYRDVRDILEKLLSSDFHQSYRYQVLNSVRINILELLILLLSRQENSDFDDEYRNFFTEIIDLIKKDTVVLNHCLSKIDKLENSKYFSRQNLSSIRRKFFAIIYSMDRSIIYRNLLDKIKGIAESELSNQSALLRFINCFVFELINQNNYFNHGSNQNERLDLALVLLYQALNRKSAQAVSPSNISFAKRLIKPTAKPTLDRQLSKFKQDYRDKIGKEFQWDVLSKGQFSAGKQVDKLPEEIAVYFSTREINRSPKAVKEAVKIALYNYGKLELSESQQTKSASIETINILKGMGSKFFEAAQKGVGKLTEKTQIIIGDVSTKATEVFEKGQGILEKSQEMKEGTIGFMKGAVNNFKWSTLITEEPHSGLSQANRKRLFSIRGKLEDMASQLHEVQSFLKENIDQNSSTIRVVNEHAETSYLNNEEFLNLEKRSKDIEKDLNAVYIHALDKFKSEIEHNSWFKNEKFSLKEQIKFFFTRGYYRVKLEKLKKLSDLNDKMDFSAEKEFFLKASFSALFWCGVIRWPWLNKEKFAMQWAEQVIFLKIKESIETTNENFNKADSLLEVLKIYHELFSSPGKKDFFSELCSDINQASIKYLPELARLFIKINSRIGYRMDADLPVAPEINSGTATSNTGFLNARNEEPGSSCQSSAKFGVTQIPFSSSI